MYLFAVLVVFMTMFHGCSTYSIDSKVCLYRPLMLATGRKACGFTLEDARKRLGSDEEHCAQKCQVKINDLYGEHNYHLIYTDLRFNGLSVHMATFTKPCGNYYGYNRTYGRRLEIVCSSDGESNLPESLCTLSKQCNDESKTCSRSWTHQIGFCVCKPGYKGFGTKCIQDFSEDLFTSTKECTDISKTCFRSWAEQYGVCVCKPKYKGFGTEFLKENLKLGYQCKRNEQRSVTSGSVCKNDTCVCGPGYGQLSDSECFPHLSEDLCTTTKECTDVSKTCFRSGAQEYGICICKPEYIGFGTDCLKGNLKLGYQCKRNEQCFVTSGSVCKNGTCVCGPGYVQLSDSECFPLHLTNDLCIWTRDCRDASKICSLRGQVGVCVCKDGYIGFINKCLKGNLKWNETCQRNEQCSEPTGSVCQNNTCVLHLTKDLCISTKDCRDASKICSLTGQVGVCVCKHGYIGFENMCLKGNLKLNETCQRNEQCSEPTGSVCQNNTCVLHLTKDLCISTKNCRDASKICSLTGQVGVCVCKHGYIGFGNMCLKGNLKLNETCQRNEQCSEPTGSVCQNNTCVLPPDDKPQSSIYHSIVNNLDGMKFGIIFGGFVLCIILTAIAVTIYHNARPRKTKTEEEECPEITVFNNASYGTIIDVVQNNPTAHRPCEVMESHESVFGHLPIELEVNKNERASNNDESEFISNNQYDKEDDVYVYQNIDNVYGIAKT